MAWSLDILQQHGEFESVSVDGACKICMRIMGQHTQAFAAKRPNTAAFPDEEHQRRILTFRGASGAVLALAPTLGESAASQVGVLRDRFTERQLACIKYLATDAPSRQLWTCLKSTCPQLTVLTLDPTHLAMNYDSAFGRVKSRGPSHMRGIMRRFTCRSKISSRSQLLPYTGDHIEDLSVHEAALRDYIQRGGIDVSVAARFLKQMDYEEPFHSRTEYIQAIACHCAVYSEDLQRTTGSGGTVRDLLWNATTAARCAWYFNNVIHRHMLSDQAALLLPSGTTSNEALHAELKDSYRQVIQIHRSMLNVRLWAFHLSKLLSHVCTLTQPTLRQNTHRVSLARILGPPVLDTCEWTNVCSKPMANGRLARSFPSGHLKRKVDMPLVKRWLRSKATRLAKKHKRRTVYTAKRSRSFVSQGVRGQQYE